MSKNVSVIRSTRDGWLPDEGVPLGESELFCAVRKEFFIDERYFIIHMPTGLAVNGILDFFEECEPRMTLPLARTFVDILEDEIDVHGSWEAWEDNTRHRGGRRASALVAAARLLDYLDRGVAA